MEIQGNKILTVGEFTEYNGNTASGILRLNISGSIDNTFTSGVGLTGSFLGNPEGYAIKKESTDTGGRLVVVGNFKGYDGITHNGIVKLFQDGSEDVLFNSGNGFNQPGRCVLIEPGTLKIFVGGDFTSYSGSSAFYFVKLNPSGSIDTSFSSFSGTDSSVLAVGRQSNGKIIIGGSFTTVNSIGRNRIARLNTDGTLDNSFNIGSGLNGNVHTITVEPATDKVIVGGSFTTFNGNTVNRIVKLNTDGTVDTSFSTGTGFNNNVFSSIRGSNGDFFIGGDFTTYNDTNAGRLVRLSNSGSLNTTFNTNIGTGLNNTVYGIIEEVNTGIITVGDFTTINGTCYNRIARFSNTGTIFTIANPCPTVTPTSTPTSTPTPSTSILLTSTPTPTPTPTNTASITATPTPTPSSTFIVSTTPTPTPTVSITSTPTPSLSQELGACCDNSDFSCTNTTQANCTGDKTWYAGEACESFICPGTPPTPSTTPTISVTSTSTPTPTPTSTSGAGTPTPTSTPASSPSPTPTVTPSASSIDLGEG